MFKTGTIVFSRFTGKRVRVTGPGRHPGTFAGECISERPPFHWDGWEISAFVNE